jgi:adenosylcobinamide-GDP ribazoletransferase
VLERSLAPPSLRPLATAVGLLTVLPVKIAASPQPRDVVHGAVLFPLVGALIGALLGATAAGLALALPALLAGTIAVGLEVVLTGALHIDGLADSADGLAGRDRERALEIMRDHSLGTYGAAALVVDLVAKAAALAALADMGSVLPVVAALALSRAAPLPLAAALPYARPGEGTGRLLAQRLGTGGALVGVALALALAVAATGLWAAAPFGCLVAVTAAVGLLARRRLRGVTGDVMGAAAELTATLALVVAAAVWA